MAVDGSLKFDTKVDTSGFQKGANGIKQSCNSMISSFKKLSAAIGIAFGIAAIVQFSKESIKASNDIENAMIGLKSIVEGQGRSFEKATAFIEDYTSDGLIYATDAVTAYKNLLARGYNDDQIQKVLLAFKNSATFGRQAALSHGEAVKSATEGIKNENSILVDNAGVTKNVSMMWKDYAKSIGVGVDSLTKQQKIQAEVNGIMEETKYMMGDAAKASGTFSGAVSQLGNSMKEMKGAFGAFLKPILSLVIPVINQAVLALTRFFNMLAQISTLLFGKKVFAAEQAKEQEKAVGGTVENEKELAKAVDKTNKKLGQTQSGFDELFILSKKTEENTGDLAPDVPDLGGGGNTGGDAELGGGVTISPEVERFVNWLKEMLKLLQDINFDKLKKSLEGLKKAFEPFTKSLFDGIEWAYKNIFVPLSKFTIEEVLPRYLDILAIAVDGLGFAFGQHMKNYQQFFDEFLKPIAEYAAPLFLEFLDKFKIKLQEFSDMIKDSEVFDDLREILSKVYEYLVPIFKKLIDIAAWFADFKLSSVFIDLEYKFKDLEDAIGLVADLLNGDFSGAWEHFKDLMIDNKIDKAKEQLTLLKEKFNEVKDSVVNFVSEWAKQVAIMFDEWRIKISAWWEKDVAPWFTLEKWKGIFDNIVKSLSAFWGNFSSVWGKSISDWWSKEVMPWFTVEKWLGLGKNIIDGIVSGFKSGLDFLGEIWSSFTSGFSFGAKGKASSPYSADYNANIRAYSFPTLPTIPKLARGAVLPPNREFMAIVGDQKHGTNIEAPLATIVEAFETALNKRGSDQPKGETRVQMILNGKPIGEFVIDYINSIAEATNMTPILI